MENSKRKIKEEAIEIKINTAVQKIRIVGIEIEDIKIMKLKTQSLKEGLRCTLLCRKVRH